MASNSLDLASDVSLAEAVGWMTAQGYSCGNPANAVGSFTVLVVSDGTGYDHRDLKTYSDLPYYLIPCENRDEVADELGCMLCGGLFTALGVFEGQRNITETLISRTMGVEVPAGDTPFK